jgi:hypothetical protein
VGRTWASSAEEIIPATAATAIKGKIHRATARAAEDVIGENLASPVDERQFQTPCLTRRWRAGNV